LTFESVLGLAEMADCHIWSLPILLDNIC
jgi:hypothetical protein